MSKNTKADLSHVMDELMNEVASKFPMELGRNIRMLSKLSRSTGYNECLADVVALFTKSPDKVFTEVEIAMHVGKLLQENKVKAEADGII